jgi:hypothetical protein
LVYHKETTIAEKLHALVTLERGNSRMKDFFDLYVLAQEFAFTGDRLIAAVRDAFAKRGTAIPLEKPDGLTQDFAADAGKLAQWKAFLNQNVSPPRDTLTLSEVITAIAAFLLPILDRARIGTDDATKPMQWTPGGLWQEAETQQSRQALDELVALSEEMGLYEMEWRHTIERGDQERTTDTAQPDGTGEAIVQRVVAQITESTGDADA